MRLFYYRSPDGITNFGDDMNPWFWKKILHLPKFESEGALLVGIGTLLNDLHPELRTHNDVLVCGTGVGYGHALPIIHKHWHFYCVRGPLSAQALGLNNTLAITDPALLLRRLVNVEPRKTHAFGFMPHVIHANTGWSQICDILGFKYISPSADVVTVIKAIAGVDTLITESLHGAIVADSFRVPWIAVKTNKIINTFKWQDWCNSVGLEYQPILVPAAWPAQTGASTWTSLRNQGRLIAIGLALRWVAHKNRSLLSKDSLTKTLERRLEDVFEKLRQDLSMGKFT